MLWDPSVSANNASQGDFEAVAFQAFSVVRNPAHSSSRTVDWNTVDNIRAAEAELRRERHLVVQDAVRPWLWLFRAVTLDQVGQKPLELPELAEFCFNREWNIPLDGCKFLQVLDEQNGSMKASELARPPMRSASAVAASGSPMTAASSKAPQAAGARQPQGNAALGMLDAQQYDTFAIYELFTSSVVALISYHLVKDYSAVALNYRTFVSRPTNSQAPDMPPTVPKPALRLTDIDVSWASSGTLIVTTFSTTKPDLYSLDQVSEEEQKVLLGKCIRLAPNGFLAQIVSFADPLDAATEDARQTSQRKRPRVNPLERGIERWKSTVVRWLAWKGYSVPFLEKRSSWVRIQIAQTGQTITHSPAFSRSFKEILWPRALCFYFPNSEADFHPDQSTNSQEDSALAWFETSHSRGFKNPIDVAQQWFLGKPDRDKVAEARRRSKKAEEDAARAKEENQGLLPSSPLNARTGTYGELHNVSGVYPTPPDGVPPGTAISSSDTPSVSGVTTTVILPPGGNNPGINMSAPPGTILSDAQQVLSTSPNLAAPYDDYNADGNNDDLFEDMDEDNFEGNGITDADFNYFDEPDGEDVTMDDAPSAEDVKPTPAALGKGKSSSSLPANLTKDDSLQPVTNRMEASVTAPMVGQKTKGEVKTERLPSNETSHVTGPDSQTPSQPPEAQAPVILQANKEPTPPLSPRFIEGALLPSPTYKDLPLTPQKQTSTQHRDSVFDPLHFSRKMSLSDAKYRDGRFGLPSGKPEGKAEAPITSHRPKSLRDLPLLTKLRYAIGVAATNGTVDTTPLPVSDSDMSDTSSEGSSIKDDEETESVSVAPRTFIGNLVIPVKRKLPTDGNATPLSTTSFADSFGGDFAEFTGLQTDDTTLSLLEPVPSDWSLVNVPPPTELALASTRYAIPTFAPTFSSVPSTPTSQPDISMDLIEEKPLSGKDSISIAQIATDQVVSATLDILHEDLTPQLQELPPSEVQWQGAIKAVFPKAVNCNVTSLASVQDVFPDLSGQTKAQQRPPPRKPNENASMLGHHMHQINPPYIRVRRGEVLWDLLPPALPFWEPLGLAPCSPSKNVVAFGIYPYSEALTPCVESFMVNMQLTYDSCRLGNHVRSDVIPEFQGGLVPCKMTSLNSTRTAFKALRDTCIQLGKLLSAKHAQMRDKDDNKIDAFVIYMIDPFEKASAIWELCAAFWSLFQAYGPGPPARPEQIQRPDLVLQIVPIKYVASFESPIILNSSVYASLAREVYDRCPPSAPSDDRTPLSIYSAPSFQLEETVPRSIPFKLNADPPQDLLRENSYIHIGYAISLDGTWVTVAWTDTCGKSQAVVSYNLGTREFREIAKEIWQTTVEILQARRVTWRVCIAKAGVMERDELEAWVFLVSSPTQLNLFITLLTVDTDPRLRFTPTMPPGTLSSNPNNPSVNTPGSTPQAGVSPEQGLTPAATPSVDNTSDPANDPDARLVDMTDDTWGIILAHRLHNSNSTNEFRPALISGLLCKRGVSPTIAPPPNSPDPARGPIIVAVNILWMGAVNPTRAATSPFPAGDGISPGTSSSGGVGGSGASAMQSQSPAVSSPLPQERSYSSLTWTPTAQTRAAAENLLKEVLGQFRGLGLLARLKGVKGCKHGGVPWHVAAAVRGVKGLEACVPK